jgi:hypothetical protein
MSVVDLILRFTPAVILLVLAVVFVRRHFYKEFPLFFAYVAFSLIATAARFSVRNEPVPYFVVYWTTDAIYALLALLALNEVFKRVFELDYKEHPWFRFVLPLTALVIAGFFITQPYVLSLAPAARISNIIFSFDIGVHCLEGVILLLFLLLQKILASAYDQYESGILTGFGLAAYITMSADVARSDFGSGFELYFRYAPPLGYILAAAIWLHAFVRKPLPQQKLKIRISELLQLLKRQQEFMDKISKWADRQFSRRRP